MNQRKKYAPDFKAKVAIEALQGNKTMAQLSVEFGVHQTQIANWVKELREGASQVFNRENGSDQIKHAKEINKLHAKIGQLIVERDFLADACGRI